MIKFLFLISCLINLISCGGSGGDDGDSSNSRSPVRVASEDFGVDGNLWKPSGDSHGSSPGSVVVIISSRYTKQFDYCEVYLRDGTTLPLTCINNVSWTHIPYSCFANGNRQHWRSFTSCHDFAEVKATCYLDNQEYLFKAPAGQAGSVCTRFG